MDGDGSGQGGSEGAADSPQHRALKRAPHTFSVLLIEAFLAAEGPLCATECHIALNRATSRAVVYSHLQNWLQAGILRVVYQSRAPVTDIPGVWPGVRKRLKCYELTPLGRKMAEEQKALRDAGIVKGALPL